MSYISPIKLNTIPDMEEGWTDKIAKYIAGETDKLVLESCVKVACDVDEEELLKALQYDRGQYEKGYADGKRDAAPRWVRCEEPPENACDCLVCWTTIHDEETGEVTGHGFWCEKGWYETGGVLEDGFYCQNRVEIHPVRVEPDYWMPIEPPKEDA